MVRIDWATFRERAPKRINGFPTGTRVYKGYQGSGKTLSMVHYAKKILKAYPDCLAFSNIIFYDEPRVNYFNTNDQLADILSLNVGEKGLILLLDEAHLFFNRKKGIPIDFLASISQQRKNRMHIVMSSQIWEELDISLRKQVKTIVSCRSMLRTIIINDVSDGESLTYDKIEGAYVANHLYTEVFHMTKRETQAYDTYQRISRNDDYSRGFSSTLAAMQDSGGPSGGAGRHLARIAPPARGA